jgi:glutathione-specific gamma-glutamylcyclotransferase
MMRSRQMRLTPDLVRRVALAAGDITPGPISAGRRPVTDVDYDVSVGKILADASSRDEVWIFAYGSLIWNPGFEFSERQVAVAEGWRRSFCLGWDRRFRGSAKHPGLMLALDHGGRCKGAAYRLAADSVEANLHKLVRREIHVIPHPFPARWIKLRMGKGPVRAVAFAIDRSSGLYIGGLAPEEVADVLAVAVGQLGSMAEYLYSTVNHLEELGIHDKHLWRLQELVADRIELSLPVPQTA